MISPECSADGCSSPVIVQTQRSSKTGQTLHKPSKFCLIHHRLDRARQAAAREAKPELKRKRLERRRKRTHERKRADPGVLVSIAAYKRRARLRSKLEAWCTKAYLKNAAAEESRYSIALRKWIRNHNKLTPEQVSERKRQLVKERYWRDPEAGSARVQAYKHSCPDYRKRCDLARGTRQAEQSDGTLTRDAVKALFGASKQCPYCGDKYVKSRKSLDHIVALSSAKGSKLHSLSNVIICCLNCNRNKQTKELPEFLAELKSKAGHKRTRVISSPAQLREQASLNFA